MTILLKQDLLAATLRATTIGAVEDILGTLPINGDYVYDKENPRRGWVEGKLHYVPVGLDPGNAGRIKLGNDPDNRIAERVVNMIEALIELKRRLELLGSPGVPPPASPREAVQRYFGLPRLDKIPEIAEGKVRTGQLYKSAKALAKRIRVRVLGSKAEREIIFEDDGIGQAPSRLHSTILSLGGDNKIKEPYLIGMWGQGGSSALAASQITWIVSRRAPELHDAEDGVGWTVVRELMSPGLRRPYYAYLAATPTGEAPSIPAAAANSIGFDHGTRIGHLGFDMGTLDPTKVYQAMNHVLPNPVLPFDICTKSDGSFDTCWGLGYLLTRRRVQDKTALDKRFEAIPVAAKEGSR